MPTEKRTQMYIGWHQWLKCIQLSQVQVQSSNKRMPENARIFLITTLRILMKKAACFGGMFLHPPQWWRDFCTVCKSLTRVASVGYTTNESSRLRCCQECTLSFKGLGGVDHRKKRPSKVDAQYTGCPSSFLLRSFE